MSSYCISERHPADEDDITSLPNQFEDNYHGILTHNGEIKVAKGDVEQIILHIDDNGTVLVRGTKSSYSTLIHAKLLPLINYATKGDTAFIKFRRSEAFIVGFRKKKRVDSRV